MAFKKITAQEAASYIENGAKIGFGGFTASGLSYQAKNLALFDIKGERYAAFGVFNTVRHTVKLLNSFDN